MPAFSLSISLPGRLGRWAGMIGVIVIVIVVLVKVGAKIQLAFGV